MGGGQGYIKQGSWKGHTEKVTSGRRTEGDQRIFQRFTSGKSFLARGNGMCNGPEVRMRSVCPGSSKEPMCLK